MNLVNKYMNTDLTRTMGCITLKLQVNLLCDNRCAGYVNDIASEFNV